MRLMNYPRHLPRIKNNGKLSMHFDEIDIGDFSKTNYISRKYNHAWKRFAGRRNIGDCSNLFQRLQPSDCYDFYIKYTEDGEKTVHDRESFMYCGRTEDEIEELAKKYMKACGNPSFPFEDFVKNIYMHTIVETFLGQEKEKQVGQMLVNMGYTYEKPVGNEDSRMNIDFKVYKGGKMMFVLQVKPKSFFTGTRNYSLIEDRIAAFRKELLVLENFGVPTYYMLYKTDNKGNIGWLSEGGKVCFRLSRLCNEETGYPMKLPNEYKSWISPKEHIY